ncbi:MAG: hypothetical protein RR646_07050 [Erysipelotrichaceae bacterium]
MISMIGTFFAYLGIIFYITRFKTIIHYEQEYEQAKSKDLRLLYLLSVLCGAVGCLINFTFYANTNLISEGIVIVATLLLVVYYIYINSDYYNYHKPKIKYTIEKEMLYMLIYYSVIFVTIIVSICF